MMKTLAITVFALGLAGFAMPADACSWQKQSTTQAEKPQEKVENPST